MGLTASKLQNTGLAAHMAVLAELTFDSAYPTGGEEFPPGKVGLGRFEHVLIEGRDGYTFQYDFTHQKIKAFEFTGDDLTPAVGAILDDADAATKGVALYAHTTDGVLAHLQFVSPTNTDGVLSIGTLALFVTDSDNAATGGLQVYTDGAALLVVSPTGEDLFVPVAGGPVLRLTHDADAATNGIAVYFDEDATDAGERLLYVSGEEDPTNAAISTDATVQLLSGKPTGALKEVANNADLSALSGIKGFFIGY